MAFGTSSAVGRSRERAPEAQRRALTLKGSMNIEPSDAFAIRINSHRHLWNGQIRANPIQWNCEAPDSFREIRCESGSERCYHLHVLASGAPRVVVLDPSAERLLADNPRCWTISSFFSTALSLSCVADARRCPTSWFTAGNVPSALVSKRRDYPERRHRALSRRLGRVSALSRSQAADDAGHRWRQLSEPYQSDVAGARCPGQSIGHAVGVLSK